MLCTSGEHSPVLARCSPQVDVWGGGVSRFLSQNFTLRARARAASSRASTTGNGNHSQKISEGFSPAGGHRQPCGSAIRGNSCPPLQPPAAGPPALHHRPAGGPGSGPCRPAAPAIPNGGPTLLPGPHTGRRGGHGGNARRAAWSTPPNRATQKREIALGVEVVWGRGVRVGRGGIDGGLLAGWCRRRGWVVGLAVFSTSREIRKVERRP